MELCDYTVTWTGAHHNRDADRVLGYAEERNVQRPPPREPAWRPLSPEQRERILSLVATGTPASTVAASSGVCVQTVYRLMAQAREEAACTSRLPFS